MVHCAASKVETRKEGPEYVAAELLTRDAILAKDVELLLDMVHVRPHVSRKKCYSGRS